jgi:hypothetical protein
MRVIVIDDAAIKALIHKLRLGRFEDHEFQSAIKHKLSQEVINDLVAEIHAHMHHTVTQWLKDQGASI